MSQTKEQRIDMIRERDERLQAKLARQAARDGAADGGDGNGIAQDDDTAGVLVAAPPIADEPRHAATCRDMPPREPGAANLLTPDQRLRRDELIRGSKDDLVGMQANGVAFYAKLKILHDEELYLEHGTWDEFMRKVYRRTGRTGHSWIVTANILWRLARDMRNTFRNDPELSADSEIGKLAQAQDDVQAFGHDLSSATSGARNDAELEEARAIIRKIGEGTATALEVAIAQAQNDFLEAGRPGQTETHRTNRGPAESFDHRVDAVESLMASAKFQAAVTVAVAVARVLRALERLDNHETTAALLTWLDQHGDNRQLISWVQEHARGHLRSPVTADRVEALCGEALGHDG